MRKLFLISIFFLVLVSSIFAVDPLFNKDDIFNELKVNDGIKKESVFVVNNLDTNIISKQDLTIEFNEVCGHVKDYEILMYQECRKTKTIYDTIIKEVCTTNIDDKNTTQTCNNRTTRENIRELVYYEWDYCDFNFLPMGKRDYKIKADIEWGDCGGGWGYEIDWIPQFKLDGKIYKQDKWAWWNSTWGSKYTIDYTCNFGGDCVREWVNLNYSAATTCDDDLRVIYQNTSEILFEINDTEKMVYFFVNGTSATLNNDYSLFCDNDGASDGSTADVMLGFTSCDNTASWTLYNDGLIAINTSGTTINRSGYGSHCYIDDLDGTGADGANFITGTSPSSGVVYGSYFVNFKSTSGGSENFNVWTDTDQNGGCVIWTSSTDLDAYSNVGGSTEIKAAVPLNTWHILKLAIDLDGSDYDLWYNNIFKLDDKPIRTDTWGDTIDRLHFAEDGTAHRVRTDQIVLSGYNVSIFPTKGTVVLGARETEIGVGIDLLFKNETGTFKTTFDESEDIFGFINLTFDGSGDPVNDSNCTMTFENGVFETEFENNNFSLCGTGCDFEKLLFNISDLSNVSTQRDEIRVSACIYSFGAREVSINATCSGGNFLEEGNGSQSPLCEVGVAEFIFNTSVCKNDNDIQIEILNSDPNNLRFQVLGLEYDRIYTNLTNNLTFNSTSGLYQNDKVEYYVHGNKSITGECENPDDAFNKTLSEVITIVNIPPSVFHLFIDVSNVGNFSFIDDVIVNMTNLSTVIFSTAVFDDDFSNATHLLKCVNGVLLNETHTEGLDTHILFGTNFTDGSCNFTTMAFDQTGESTNLTTNFIVNKISLPPTLTAPVIIPLVPTASTSLNCTTNITDIEFVDLTTDFFWLKNGVLESGFSVTINTTTDSAVFTSILIPTTELTVGDNWTCSVFGNNTQVVSATQSTTVTISEIVVIISPIQFDTTTIQGVLMIVVLIFLWVLVLALGIFTNSPVIIIIGFLIGFFIAFGFLQINIIIAFLFMMLNGWGAFKTLIG